MLDIEVEEELVRKVGGKFRLTALIQKRMVELNRGAPPLVEVDADELTSREIVCQEILQGKIELVRARARAVEVAGGVVVLLPDPGLGHGQSRRKRPRTLSHHTRQMASLTIFFDIFDSPESRSVNRIGSSIMEKPRRYARNFSSI